MAVSNKHILQQGPVLRTLASTALSAIKQQLSKAPPRGMPPLPGPEITVTIPPRPAGLVRDYVRHVGGDPSAYKNVVPAHLFPQWGFGLATATLKDIPYPLVRVLNGRCRLQMNTPLPQGEPLIVRARLEGIDDNGRRAVIHQRVVTGTVEVPEAIAADMFAIVPTGGGDKANGSNGAAQTAAAKKEKPRVPDDAEEIARWRIGPKAGLDFAKLTGDFNPVHWIPPYAKAMGFRNTILHGFGTMARAIEGLQRGLFAGSIGQLAVFDCKFTRPLVLPAKVGLYTRGDGEVYVGDAPGGPAYLVGTFQTREGLSQ